MILQSVGNKNIKKIVAASLLACAYVWNSASAAEPADVWKNVQKVGVLKCGAAVASPYVMRNASTGDYSGFFAQLCKDFGEKVLKVKVEMVDSSWDNIVAGLQSGKWDMALALNQSPERALAVGFSIPVNELEVSFVVSKENPKLPASHKLADFDKPGVVFAVMSGSNQDKAITAAIKQGNVMRLPGMDEARMAVMSRRADVLVDANDTNHLFAQANPSWTKEVMPEPALMKQGVSFGVPRDISPADLQALNIFIKQRQDSGEVSALIEKFSAEAVAQTKQ